VGGGPGVRSQHRELNVKKGEKEGGGRGGERHGVEGNVLALITLLFWKKGREGREREGWRGRRMESAAGVLTRCFDVAPPIFNLPRGKKKKKGEGEGKGEGKGEGRRRQRSRRSKKWSIRFQKKGKKKKKEKKEEGRRRRKGVAIDVLSVAFSYES